MYFVFTKMTKIIQISLQQVQNKNLASPLKNSDDKELEQLIVKCGRLPKVIVAVAKFLAPKTVTCMESTRTLNRRFMHELESNPEFCGLRDLFGWMHSYFRTCPDFLRPCNIPWVPNHSAEAFGDAMGC